MSSYEYNCNKLEQLRDIFNQINNKNNIAYNNKYYDLPFNNEVIDIVYFGNVFNSDKYIKISEFDILDARIKLGVDYKKYSLIPLFKSNKSEYVVYNYNISKYQLYLVGKVNEENYNQLSTDNNVIIDDLGVIYLKRIEEDFDICKIVDKKKLLAKHNEYQEKSKAVYNAILNNEYLGKILKTSFYIDLPKNKNVERCEKVGNEVANILNDLVPIKQGQNNDIELIIRQKMLFGMLDIAKIRNDVFTAYIKYLKEQKTNTSNQYNNYNDIEKLYKTKLLSQKINDAFELDCNNLNHLRKLDMDEILNASKELQVNFVEIGLIPLFDIFDNDFICFDINNNEWCVFNIVDEIKFKKSSQLEELLNFKK